MNQLIETEVLIIGSGIAGGTAALQLADQGIPVTVVTRAIEPEDSNTLWAQGGIIAGGPAGVDSAELLAQDILNAGAGHSFPPAVEILAEEGPALVREVLIDKLGIQFDANSDGSLQVIKEAAHSAPRIVHVADSTGRAIEVALLNRLKRHPQVRLLTGHTAVDLLTPSHHARNRLAVYGPNRCIGAYVLNQADGHVRRILAKKTILATGGLGQIYLRTTNPRGARGDGIAMAYRAGARVINLEYVQFHPTTFHQENAPHFLISEAVRGLGARLTDQHGVPFMQAYDAQWKDLAPRDVVARSMHAEMLKTGVNNVYLDLRSYIPADTIAERFPAIQEECAHYGIDITRDLVPVTPGAHYACGGVWVDAWGRTTIDDLYAVGEVACTGLHGANRLASTSLLEGLVWGDRAARHIEPLLTEAEQYEADQIPVWSTPEDGEADPVLIEQDMLTIQQIMWNYVGLVRTTPRLARALRELRHLETEIEQFYRVVRPSDHLIGLRNAVRTAILVSFAAWRNKESRGCHYRV